MGSDAQLVPLSYVIDDGTKDGDDDTVIAFDWINGTVATVDKGRDAMLELAPGMIERHILPLAIGLGLRHGAAPQSLTLVERDRIKSFDITAQGNEPDRVRRSRSRHDEISPAARRIRPPTSIWFAPDLGFVPVKIQFDKRGLRHASCAATAISLGGP